MALAWRASYKGGTSYKEGYLIREVFSDRRWRHVANRYVYTGDKGAYEFPSASRLVIDEYQVWLFGGKP